MTGKRDCACPRARHQHGTRGAYQKDGCRCFACRIATSRIDKQGRNGNGYCDPGVLIPRAGTVRRLQALHAIGWSEKALADRLGVTKQSVGLLRNYASDMVYALTAVQVAVLYDELWDQQPEGRYVTRTRRWAAAQGWVPPLGWDDDAIDDPAASPCAGSERSDVLDKAHLIDDIAVAEAVAGRRVGLTVQERRQAVHQLTAQGLSAREIGERLGVTGRAVVRGRSAA